MGSLSVYVLRTVRLQLSTERGRRRRRNPTNEMARSFAAGHPHREQEAYIRLSSVYSTINPTVLSATAVRHDFHLVALIERAQAHVLHRRDMDENILAAGVGVNEAKALLPVERLQGTKCRHERWAGL